RHHQGQYAALDLCGDLRRERGAVRGQPICRRVADHHARRPGRRHAVRALMMEIFSVRRFILAGVLTIVAAFAFVAFDARPAAAQAATCESECGEPTPAPSPTYSPSPTPTYTPSPTPSPSPYPSSSPSPYPSSSPSPAPTPTGTDS